MTNNTISSSMTEAQTSTGSKASVRAACATVFLIGATLVFLVGFAHSATLHNAAHDTRHGLAFPCH